MQKSSKMNQVSKDSGGDCLEKPYRENCLPVLFVFSFPHCTENEKKTEAGRRLTEASMESLGQDKGRWPCVGQNTNTESAVISHSQECTLMGHEIPVVTWGRVPGGNGFPSREMCAVAVRRHVANTGGESH